MALNSIRELLVMMRIWGLLKPQSLPVFSRSDENLDVLLQTFKLLTRLALNPMDPDEFLLGIFVFGLSSVRRINNFIFALDECCTLPSQVLIPQLQFISSQTAVASPLLPFICVPLQVTFFVFKNLNLIYY